MRLLKNTKPWSRLRHHRTVGRHRDHRHPDRPAPARRAEGPRGRCRARSAPTTSSRSAWPSTTTTTPTNGSPSNGSDVAVGKPPSTRRRLRGIQRLQRQLGVSEILPYIEQNQLFAKPTATVGIPTYMCPGRGRPLIETGGGALDRLLLEQLPDDPKNAAKPDNADKTHLGRNHRRYLQHHLFRARQHQPHRIQTCRQGHPVHPHIHRRHHRHHPAPATTPPRKKTPPASRCNATTKSGRRSAAGADRSRKAMPWRWETAPCGCSPTPSTISERS